MLQEITVTLSMKQTWLSKFLVFSAPLLLRFISIDKFAEIIVKVMRVECK